jgi:hypothetical protein
LALPIDQARLRPHLREQQQANIFRDEFERAGREEVDTTAPRWKTPVGDDFERLRGLPAVAPGVPGAMRGTNPLWDTIHRDEYRRGRR